MADKIFIGGFIFGLVIGFGLIIFQKRDTSFKSFMKVVDEIIPKDFNINDYLN